MLEVGVSSEAAGGGDGVLDAVTTGQSVDTGLGDCAGHVDEEAGGRWYVGGGRRGDGLGAGWARGGGCVERGARERGEAESDR